MGGRVFTVTTRLPTTDHRLACIHPSIYIHTYIHMQGSSRQDRTRTPGVFGPGSPHRTTECGAETPCARSRSRPRRSGDPNTGRDADSHYITLNELGAEARRGEARQTTGGAGGRGGGGKQAERDETGQLNTTVRFTPIRFVSFRFGPRGTSLAVPTRYIRVANNMHGYH